MTAAVAMLATAAVAQLQITPQPQHRRIPNHPEIRQRRAAAAGCQEAGRAEKRRAEIGRQPEGDEGAGAPAAETPLGTDNPNVDLAYGAYQRGRNGEVFRSPRDVHRSSTMRRR